MNSVFHSTAEYYARFRSGYPPEMFAHMSDRLGLAGHERVLDLGCGSGQMALPVAGYVAEVVAVDPDNAMLEEGRTLAQLVGADNVSFRLGISGTLRDLELGPIDVAMMGASFHWMDRRDTLRAIDELLPARGAVVLAGNGSPLGVVQPPWWEEVVAEIRTRWLGPQRRAGSGTYQHPQQRHEEVLADSTFSNVEKAEWTRTITRSLDEVVGLQLSYSYCAPALFGDRLPEFLAELRRELIAARPHDGRFTCSETVELMIATRRINQP